MNLGVFQETPILLYVCMFIYSIHIWIWGYHHLWTPRTRCVALRSVPGLDLRSLASVHRILEAFLAAFLDREMMGFFAKWSMTYQ